MNKRAAYYAVLVSTGILLAMFLVKMMTAETEDLHPLDYVEETTNGCTHTVSYGEYAGHPHHNAFVTCPEGWTENGYIGPTDGDVN